MKLAALAGKNKLLILSVLLAVSYQSTSGGLQSFWVKHRNLSGGKKKRKEKKRIKSAFASPKDLDCSVELTCVGCSSICLHCLESCGGLLWVCSAPLAHSPRPSAVPDRVVQQQASMLSGRPEKQFGAWLLRWKAGSMAETTLFI